METILKIEPSGKRWIFENLVGELVSTTSAMTTTANAGIR